MRKTTKPSSAFASAIVGTSDMRHAGGRLACLLNGEGRKLSADCQNDATDP
jgi:hypothetical protein